MNNKLNNPLHYSAIARLKASYIIKMLGYIKEKAILDIGCGIGYLSTIFEEKGARVYATDFHFESIAYAKMNSRGAFFVSDVCNLPIPSNSFDKVIFSEVIEHVINDQRAIQEISRICKNGGTLIITAPSVEAIFTENCLNFQFHDKKRTAEYHHRDGYITEELVRLLNMHNFEVEQIKHAFVFLSVCFEILLKFIYKLLKKEQINSQIDIITNTKNSFAFMIYKKFVFPVIYGISILEEKLFSKLLRGHMIIIKAIIYKHSFAKSKSIQRSNLPKPFR